MFEYNILDDQAKILSNLESGIRNYNLPQSLQQALMQQQITNKYLPGTLGSQIGESLAHASLLGQQSKWLGPKSQAEINLINRGQIPGYQASAGLHGAQARNQMLMNQYLGDILGAPSEPFLDNVNQANYVPSSTDLSSYGAPNQAQEGAVYTQEPSPSLGQKLAEQGISLPTGQTQQRIAPQQGLQQPFRQPLSREDKMLKIADAMALMNHQTPPSLLAGLKAREEEAVLGAKEYRDISKQYASASETATSSLRNLDQLESSLKKIGGLGTSTIIPEGIKKRFGGPEIQQAIKEANTLMIGQLRPKFGGLGQLRNMEMQKLIESLPNINMSGAALKVVNQLRTEFKVAQSQGELAQHLKAYTKNPEEIRAVIDMAGKYLSPVDETGNHPERLRLWKKFASPEAIMALRNNQTFIPDGVKPTDLPPNVRRDLIAEMQ